MFARVSGRLPRRSLASWTERACHNVNRVNIGELQHVRQIMSVSDTESDDMKRAIAMSLADQDAAEVQSSLPASASNGATPSAVGGLAGLDRKAMERERLARLAKKRGRAPSISPPPSRKAAKLEPTTVDYTRGAKLNMLVQAEQASRKTDVANAANANLKAEMRTIVSDASASKSTTTPQQGDLIYPHGVVKKTWAFGHPRTGNDIKLEEVLEPLTLRTALLSAFQWDVEWVLSKLKVPPTGGSTKCMFVMQAKEEGLREQMVKDTEGMRSFLRLCFPPMEGQTFCMHSKLMLLFHATKLRVAVPSANLLNFDWGETGMMENSVFIIDLPRLGGGTKTKLTPFAEELLYFLDKQGVDHDVREGVLSFDFAATANMAFIHSVGGISHGKEAERIGLPGLARAVRTLGLESYDLQLDFAASSIGSLKDEQLRALHSAAAGEDMIGQADAAASKAKADFFKAGKKATAEPTRNIRENLRIYFPTHDTVTSSTAGAAGTICLSRKWFEDMPFPRSVFRDYVSTRTGLLSHNKILYARGRHKREDGQVRKDVAWAYVGSANMSESAWGKLVFDKKAKRWKVNCRNWECGVLLPVDAEKLKAARKEIEVPVRAEVKAKGPGEDSETDSEDEADPEVVKKESPIVGMSVFEGVVSLPFEYPGQEYKGREPWYFQERHDR